MTLSAGRLGPALAELARAATATTDAPLLLAFEGVASRLTASLARPGATSTDCRSGVFALCATFRTDGWGRRTTKARTSPRAATAMRLANPTACCGANEEKGAASASRSQERRDEP